MKHRTLFLALVAFLAVAGPLRAHHGQEFLLVQDATTPEPLYGSLFSSFEWSKYGSEDELSLEPGFLLGVAPHVSLGATVNVADEGRGWDYQSVTPYIHVELTPRTWPVRIAVMGGYEFGQGNDDAPRTRTRTIRTTTKGKKVTRTVTTGDAAGGTDDEEPVPCGPEYGPDAPPCDDVSPPAGAASARRHSIRHSGHASHQTTVTTTTVSRGTTTTRTVTEEIGGLSEPSGIHRHGENHFFARLIVEADLTPSDKFIFNLIHVSPENGRPAWGYAAGLRHSFNHDWAVGLEAIGDFGDANEHEAVLGAYWSPTHHLTLKLGAGTGLTEESSDFSLRTGLVWRF